MAAKVACAHDFIMELPQGYASSVGERGSGLSGGQRQRIAIARALVHQPECVLADEPTGNLDEESAQMAMTQLVVGCKARGASLIIVTHNLNIAQRADRRMRLAGGRLHSDE